MTAIFTYAAPDAAYALGDGAFVGFHSGRLREIKTKILDAAADKSAVLAVSGPQKLNSRLSAQLRQFASFDDVVDGLEAEVIEIAKTLAFGFFSMRLVGWSRARSKAEVYKISGGAWPGAEAKTPVLIETTGLSVISPQEEPPIPDATRHFYQAHRLGCAPQFSATAHAVPYFFATRAKPSPLNGKHVVGGFIEEVKITAAGTRRRIVGEWADDQIGELINPQMKAA
ncbi:hypothetical protein [Mesorhizobium sophorae]|uniref:hypothetical protein n=1 Tax=Mesorhizobium sophorae TaxID=1300294 RepID=UPI000BA4CAE1|nr:hypothetical protein [Mesorhizobium sophorae]